MSTVEINAVQDNLERIAVDLHDAINASQRSWITIGELLQEARTRQPSDQEFGKWCDAQGFGLKTNALHKMRAAYVEYSVGSSATDRLTDYNAWVRIASLKGGQKARVLEKLGALDKPTRKDVEAAIAVLPCRRGENGSARYTGSYSGTTGIVSSFSIPALLSCLHRQDCRAGLGVPRFSTPLSGLFIAFHPIQDKKAVFLTYGVQGVAVMCQLSCKDPLIPTSTSHKLSFLYSHSGLKVASLSAWLACVLAAGAPALGHAEVNSASFQQSSTASSAPAPQPPYSPSPVIQGIRWDFDNLVRHAPGSDLWPFTWGADDNLYTAWGDGGGFKGTNAQGRVSVGFARISGTPLNFHRSAVNLWGGQNGQNIPTFGGKVNTLLSVDGTLYGVGCIGPLKQWGCRSDEKLVWSNDFGQSWEVSRWSYATGGQRCEFCSLSFINFGRDNQDAPNPHYIYVHFTGANQYLNVFASNVLTRVYLARVPKERIKDRNAPWEYFTGVDPVTKAPRWSQNTKERIPVFQDANGVNGFKTVYITPLNRYLATAAHGEDIEHLGIFDAPTPWGPWTTVAYDNGWGKGRFGQGEYLGLHIPLKWVSPDGLTLWGIFSTGSTKTDSTLDSFNLLKATLTLRGQ